SYKAGLSHRPVRLSSFQKHNPPFQFFTISFPDILDNMLGSNRGTTTTTTTTTKPSMMTRLRGHNTKHKTVKTTTKTAPKPRSKKTNYGIHKTHHHKRKPTIGDKVSGAMLKMKGSLTHRPGVKAAGTRRMHGTDGRGSHY
ncbi:hypothetical protein N7468_008756, partial [Penicillium chermesinum]